MAFNVLPETPLATLLERGADYNCFPLSFAQERLWFAEQLAPGAAVYNIAGGVSLQGKLDVAALERALQEIVRRHEVLRTSFHQIDGVPFQQVHQQVDFTMREAVVDPARLTAELGIEARRGFRLSEPGLLRALLLRTAEDEHVLALVLHHIIADGWSLGVLIRELGELYEANRHELPSPLADPEIQYADCAVWQREQWRSGAHEEGLVYWKEQLRGVPEALALPFEGGSRAEFAHCGRTVKVALGAELSRELRALSSSEGTTLFVVLLAAFQNLLARYTGQPDVVVGAPMGERQQLETQDLIGLFVNLVPLRICIDEGETFVDLIRRAKEVVLQAQTWQNVPFEKIIEAIGLSRSISPSPLVQVTFAWQAGLMGSVRLGDTAGTAEPIDTETAKFDLSLMLGEEGQNIAGYLEYRSDRFAPDIAERICTHYVNLLRSAVAAPDMPIRDLQMLNTSESERIFFQSQGDQLALDHSETALDLFASCAAQHPDVIALESDSDRTTYRELDSRAGDWAGHLRRLGVDAESLVGICMKRGPDAVLAMLAVLKSGAAYLPLDPDYPLDRLQYMSSDAGVSIILTHRRLLERCPAAQTIVLLDEDQPGSGPSNVMPLRASPDQHAYTIYTSGSTGRPKGVQIPHRGLKNLVLWHQKEFGLGPGDRTTQFASLSFDASVWEIWSALCTGATLCFPPSEIRTSSEELRDWLVKQRITVSFLPTPVAEGIVALEWPKQTTLRVLLTGGDRLRCVPSAALPFRFVNNYGPTETSVVATSGTVSLDESNAAPCIGRAIANTQVYVLDDDLRPVPTGIPGELYIGGEGIARGYRQRSDATAERFLPDPWNSASGARMYRTGDLASYTNEGDIRFLGRADSQVKIRGHRIEPDEIAAVLKEASGVDDALVELRTLLTAYVVSRPGVALSAPELREHVRRRLPGFMLPAAYVFVDSWPLTPNGKIDRGALPQPTSCGEAPTSYANPAEEMVGAIWSTLLARGDIGPQSDFFDLGGHSLLAAQMIVRLRGAFAKDVPLQWAFQFPVLRDLAGALSRDAARVQTHTGAIIKADRKTPLRLSLAQERLWFLDQFTGSDSAYNIAGAVRLQGELDTVALENALQEIVRRHEVLRASFCQVDGTPFMKIHEHVNFTLRRIDLRKQGAEAAELKAETRRPFQLSEPALIRASLLRTGEREHVLLLVLHHIIADGWSIGVLVRELNELYSAHRSGRVPAMHDLEVQYADYAAWQRDLLSKDTFEHNLAYWKQQLRGAPETMALPFDHDRSAGSGYTGGTVRLQINQELSQGLKELSRREGVTLFMTLLAGFKALLVRYTGQHDIVVGTDIANRNEASLEPLVGLFVNQLVLRTAADGDPSLRELLSRVKSVVLDAWAHQDMPFGSLVEALRPKRDLTRNPLFQVMVILQSAPTPELDLGEATAQSMEIDPEGSAFDLSLAFAPREDGSLTASLRHSALFETATAERILCELRSVLEHLVRDPEARISSLEVSHQMQRNNQIIEKPRRKRDLFEGLLTAKPAATAVSTAELVRVSPFCEAKPIPVLVQPTASDVDLAAWAGAHSADLRVHLRQAGALLFRGFGIHSVEQFQALTRSFSPQLIEYSERSSPRTKIGDGIYTSTDHPADQPILLHNEQSYTLNWPRKIWFFCLQPSPQGGRTPIADSRKILKRLRSETVAKFVERQVMYMRNYGDGLGLSWAEAFQTEDRLAVEEHCHKAGIEFEWKDNGGLRTRQVRPAVRHHPETGEPVWFNHTLFFHITSLPADVRNAITAGVPEQDLPFNTYYGDGSPIEPSVLDEIREAFDHETVKFDWQLGDVLLLDNMLAAHGREPFCGPRKIVVAMTEPFAALEAAGKSA